MADQITVVGSVASDVEMGHLPSGDACASFRLASSRRRVNPETRRWEDAHVNWYRVRVTRQLAEHARISLERGLRVIVTGRLTLREWERLGQRGVTAEIDAEALGLELLWRPARAADRTRRQLRAERAARAADRPGGVAGARDPGCAGEPGFAGEASRHWAPGAPGHADGGTEAGCAAGADSGGRGDVPGRADGHGATGMSPADGSGGGGRGDEAGRLSGPGPPGGSPRVHELDGGAGMGHPLRGLMIAGAVRGEVPVSWPGAPAQLAEDNGICASHVVPGTGHERGVRMKPGTVSDPVGVHASPGESGRFVASVEAPPMKCPEASIRASSVVEVDRKRPDVPGRPAECGASRRPLCPGPARANSCGIVPGERVR